MSAVTSAAPPPRGVMQQELVERARRGDHDAFAELAGASIFRLDAAARLILRDPDQAKDAVQETLVRAWRDLPTLRSPDRFEAWLHRLLYRACIDEARRLRRHRVDIEAVAPESARLVDAGPVEQAMEPGVEARRAPQCRQIAPGPDERLLDGVLGLIGVAEDEPRGRVQPEDRGSCKRRKGVMIASPRSFHELLLHVAPRRRRHRSGRAHRVWRGDRP